MNVPRMMRPGIPNPGIPNATMINPNNSLRHLLQPQGQVKVTTICFWQNHLNHFYCININFTLASTAEPISTDDGNARTK